jgi:hypothetical protein
VLLKVESHHGADCVAGVGVHVTQGKQVFRQGAGFVACPREDGGDELGLVDQAVLQSEKPEEEVGIGVHGWVSRSAPRRPGDFCRGRVAREMDYDCKRLHGQTSHPPAYREGPRQLNRSLW